MSGKIGKTEKRAPGSAPDYVMQTGFGPVQPVLVRDGIAFCPAEDWRRISDPLGFYPVICQESSYMHTAFPDPLTRRRMNASFRRIYE